MIGLLVTFLYIVAAAMAGVVTYKLCADRLANNYGETSAPLILAVATALLLPLAIPVWVGVGLAIFVLSKFK